MASLERRAEWRWLAVALVAAVVVLAVCRDVYWRPFDDTTQESVASFHAYGFAAAAGTGLWPNPIVARHIDVGHSVIKPYPHWPNGFFLALEGVLRVFGRTETVGRTVAIAGTLLGFTLVVVSVGRKTPLVYAAVPLLLVSAAGRDAVSFVFVDVALYAFIGVLLWTSGFERPGAFRAAILAGLVSTHLVAPYAAVFALLRWFERRSRRGLAIDLAVLGAGGLAVLLALAAGASDLSGGVEELRKTIDQRARAPLGDCWKALSGDLGDSLRLGPLSVWLAAAAWGVALRARQWRVALLMPSFLLFTLLLRGYVAEHDFARLPWVFFSLVTLLAGAGLMIERRLLAGRAAAARVLLLTVLTVALAAGRRHYQVDSIVQGTRNSLLRITQDPALAPILKGCNAFQFQTGGHQYTPHDRIAQFFFGPQVVERVRRGDPIRTCHLDLVNHSVHQHH